MPGPLRLDGAAWPDSGWSVWNVSGTHRPRTHGLLIAAGPDIARGAELERVSIHDVAPTVLYALGLPYGRDFAGRPAVDLFAPAVPGPHAAPGHRQLGPARVGRGDRIARRRGVARGAAGPRIPRRMSREAALRRRDLAPRHAVALDGARDDRTPSAEDAAAVLRSLRPLSRLGPFLRRRVPLSADRGVLPGGLRAPRRVGATRTLGDRRRLARRRRRQPALAGVARPPGALRRALLLAPLRRAPARRLPARLLRLRLGAAVDRRALRPRRLLEPEAVQRTGGRADPVRARALGRRRRGRDRRGARARRLRRAARDAAERGARRPALLRRRRHRRRAGRGFAAPPGSGARRARAGRANRTRRAPFRRSRAARDRRAAALLRRAAAQPARLRLLHLAERR